MAFDPAAEYEGRISYCRGGGRPGGGGEARDLSSIMLQTFHAAVVLGRNLKQNVKSTRRGAYKGARAVHNGRITFENDMLRG